MKRVRVVAAGLVQGVFFRASVRDEARRLDVTGWVRNTRSGDVEGEFQGDDAAVAKLLDYCRRGPGHAVVDRLDVSERQTVADERGFDVRHDA